MHTLIIIVIVGICFALGLWAAIGHQRQFNDMLRGEQAKRGPEPAHRIDHDTEQLLELLEEEHATQREHKLC